MNHVDHTALIQDGIPSVGGTWADFGSGTGAFALALAELVGSNGCLYLIDKKRDALRQAIMRAEPGVMYDGRLDQILASPITILDVACELLPGTAQIRQFKN